MGELVKMKIIGFKDGKFRQKVDELELQINPDSLKYSMGISYSKDKRLGITEKEIKFESFDNSTLSFEFFFDDTGIVPLNKNLADTLNYMETILYDVEGDTHEPNYLHVNWGSFNYKGRITSLSYNYTMFRPDGSPLRVKISVTVTGYMDKISEARSVNRNSPDLSRIIVLKAGESIPYWCDKIYGDASYCVDIAEYNKLSSFRDASPGMQLMFPPLKRS